MRMNKIKKNKNKIKEENKSFVKDTINGLSTLSNQFASRRENGYDNDNDNDNDDDDEMDGLIPSGGGGRGAEKKSNNTTTNNNNTIVWKTLAFVLFAILILFATDVLEFRQASSVHNGNSSSTASMIDGSVEQKRPTVVNEDRSGTENAKVDAELAEAKKKIEQEEGAAGAKTKMEEEKAAAQAQATEEAKKKMDEEAEAKTKADQEAAAEAEKKKEEEKAAMEAKKKMDEEKVAAKAHAENEAKKKADEEAKAKAETEAKKKSDEDVSITAAATQSTTDTDLEIDMSRHTYTRRGRPMSDKDRKAMVEEWGRWMFEDKKERPTDDYYAAYPNRDIPRKEFPSNAWQTDNDYLSDFLPESIKLVDRTINAIMDEYGQPRNGSSVLFHVEKHEKWVNKMEKQPCNSQCGCTTTTSWENLKRRLLHAVMTEDMFVFAMGGHSAAAGHGNHFQQSYTLQVQWILEGVFSRLGVRHQSRNFGFGGLGTTQSGIATKSLFGHDVDMLLWDSGMTEQEAEARDMFFRQGILGDGKVPMIMSTTKRNDVLAVLNENADADIFMLGDQSSLPTANNVEEVLVFPWAAQYVHCGNEISGICRENEYAGQCWIDRDDFNPKTNQNSNMGGRAKWHPGNRKHQLKGRAITFTILEALKEALTLWNDTKDYEIADDTWHVTPTYDNIRTKVENLKPNVGSCRKYESKFSSFMCNTAIKARTEFTPRGYPDHTNIRTLMPPTQAEQINDPPENAYQPPDVFNVNLHPPVGAIDVLSIIEAGLPYKSNLSPDYSHFYRKPKFEKKPTLPVGKGYYLDTYSGFCDGSVDSWCNKGPKQKCLLYNHNDGRNGLLMDSYCGWMVTNLPELRHGFIVLKLESWHASKENPKTKAWNSVNGERRELYQESDRTFLRSVNLKKENNANYTNHEKERKLKFVEPDYCADFRFEFAIDGKVTTLTKNEFIARKAVIQRVIEVVKIAEDTSITGGDEKEVEFAFRMTGCTNNKTFKVTHIYWA